MGDNVSDAYDHIAQLWTDSWKCSRNFAKTRSSLDRKSFSPDPDIQIKDLMKHLMRWLKVQTNGHQIYYLFQIPQLSHALKIGKQLRVRAQMSTRAFKVALKLLKPIPEPFLDNDRIPQLHPEMPRHGLLLQHFWSGVDEWLAWLFSIETVQQSTCRRLRSFSANLSSSLLRTLAFTLIVTAFPTKLSQISFLVLTPKAGYLTATYILLYIASSKPFTRLIVRDMTPS